MSECRYHHDTDALLLMDGRCIVTVLVKPFDLAIENALESIRQTGGDDDDGE
ncbi:hypothetical protein ACFFQF_01045 [Haladaptatus pallidirubidus]